MISTKFDGGNQAAFGCRGGSFQCAVGVLGGKVSNYGGGEKNSATAVCFDGAKDGKAP